LKYYAGKYKRVCIIHDGIIFHQSIDLTQFRNAKSFWHFNFHCYDNKPLGLQILNQLTNGSTVGDLYYSNKWFGSMGCISVVEDSFLQKLQEKYNLLNLSSFMDTNIKAMEFERILGVLFHAEYPDIKYDPSFFGEVTQGLEWGLTFDKYLREIDTYKKRPLVKIFGSRLSK
jgi:hypothetical protein